VRGKEKGGGRKEGRREGREEGGGRGRRKEERREETGGRREEGGEGEGEGEIFTAWLPSSLVTLISTWFKYQCFKLVPGRWAMGLVNQGGRTWHIFVFSRAVPEEVRKRERGKEG
jgi:hypothetical protein